MWKRSWIVRRYGFGRRQPWSTWKFYLGDNVETNSVSWSNRWHSCLVGGRSWYKYRPAGRFQWLLFPNFLVTLLHVLQDWQSVQHEQQPCYICSVSWPTYQFYLDFTDNKDVGKQNWPTNNRFLPSEKFYMWPYCTLRDLTSLRDKQSPLISRGQ